MPRREPIAVLAGADRRDCRFLHVDRCREVGLADAERDDVLALTRERIDFGEHDERVLGAERLGAARERRDLDVDVVRSVHEAPLCCCLSR